MSLSEPNGPRGCGCQTDEYVDSTAIEARHAAFIIRHQDGSGQADAASGDGGQDGHTAREPAQPVTARRSAAALRSAGADQRRITPPRPGPRRQRSDDLGITISRENRWPPARTSGGHQPGQHPAVYPDFSMTVDSHPQSRVRTAGRHRCSAAAPRRHGRLRERCLGIASHWPFEFWGRLLPAHTTAVSLLDGLCTTPAPCHQRRFLPHARSLGPRRHPAKQAIISRGVGL